MADTSGAFRPTAPQTTGGYHSTQEFIPRFGMFAGPNYAGGQTFGNNVTPGTATWSVVPVNFIDQVTRNHDINYTWIEKLYSGNDAATKLAKDKALWQADKEMLINVMAWRPPEGDWISAMYRDSMIKGFAAKALGYSGINALEEWKSLGALDRNYATMPVASYVRDILTIGGTVYKGGKFQAYGMESLTGSGLNVQQMLLFNQHITPAQAASFLRNQDEGLDAPQNFDRKVIIPQQDLIDRTRYFSVATIGGKLVKTEMRVDRDTGTLTMFTREVYSAGILVERIETVGSTSQRDAFGQSALTSTKTTYVNGTPTTTTLTIAAPEVTPLTVSAHTYRIASKVTSGELATMDAIALAAERAIDLPWLAGEEPLLKPVDEQHERAIEAFRRSEILARNIEEAGGVTQNTVSLTTDTTDQLTDQQLQDITSALNTQGQVAGDGNWSLLMAENTANTDSTYAGGIMSDAGSGGWRPGNGNLSGTADMSAEVANIFDELRDFQGIGSQVDHYYNQAAIATNAGVNTPLVPADPLILDLSGDGVSLSSYADSRALFDVDNDGGSREHTGWVKQAGAATDGILVHDLNGDGRINSISETLSEYYNGVAGTGGNPGTKPYAHGFAALKSLDGNNDNQFTAADAAWNSLRVWVDDNADGLSFKDSNGNGIKDAGEASELKTFAELGITAISLTAGGQSGLVNGGNDVLASGTFVQNGQSKAAEAVRFIADPNGATWQTGTANGVAGATLTTQGASGAANVKSYVSGNASISVSEALDAANLDVANLYAGAGNDTLNGTAAANWLAGGAGGDTFDAGAGDDVLLIDADDLQQNIHAGAGNDVVQVVGDAGVVFDMAQAEAEVFVGGTGGDVVAAGGRSTVFIRGGAGNDLIVGGAANDVLSGEDGNDFIDGGAGNDLVRGHGGATSSSEARATMLSTAAWKTTRSRAMPATTCSSEDAATTSSTGATASMRLNTAAATPTTASPNYRTSLAR